MDRPKTRRQELLIPSLDIVFRTESDGDTPGAWFLQNNIVSMNVLFSYGHLICVPNR